MPAFNDHHQPNARLGADFLVHLTAPGGRLTIVTIKPDGPAHGRTFVLPKQKSELFAHIKAQETRSVNVYYVANETGEVITGRNGVPNDDDIVSIRGFIVDADPRKGQKLATERDRLRGVAADALEQIVLPWAIEDTGGGIQIVYPLAVPLEATPENKARARAQMKSLARRFGGDMVACTLKNLFRVPGTRNLPTKAKQADARVEAVSGLWHNGGPRVTVEDLETLAPPKDADTEDDDDIDPTIAVDGQDLLAVLGNPDTLPEDLKAKLGDVNPVLRELLEMAEEDRTHPAEGRSGWDFQLACTGLRAELSVEETMLVLAAYGSEKVAERFKKSGTRAGFDYVKGTVFNARKATRANFGSVDEEEWRPDEDPIFGDTGGNDAEETGNRDDVDDHEEEDIDPALLNPPGLVGDIADWIDRTAIQQCRPHAVLAGLAAVGTIVSREVYTLDMPSGTHLYYAAIAPTGLGKQHQFDAIKLLLDEATGSLFQSYDGWHETSQSLMESLAQTPVKLVMADEFADKLLNLRQRNVSTNAQHLSELFRELWGVSTGVYETSQALSRKKHRIGRPAFSFWGNSTLTSFTAILTETGVANGLLNRILGVPAYKVAPPRKDVRKGALTVPPELADRCHRLSANAYNNALHDFTTDRPPNHFVPMSEKASEMDFGNREFQHRQLGLTEDYPEMALYARFAEMVKRVALIVACGRHPDDLAQAVIEEGDMTFAHGFVLWSCRQMVTLVRRYMTENEQQRNFLKVRRIVFRAGANGIRRNALVKKLKGAVNPRQLNEIIQVLIDGDEIRKHDVTTGGRKATVYVRTGGKQKSDV